MDYDIIFAYAFAVLILYLLIKLFYVPIRYLLYIVYAGVIGAVVIWGINVIGPYFGFHLPLNIITSLAVGYLGLPGVIMVAILQALFT